MNLNEQFRKLARTSADALGTPWVFVLNVLLILVWLAAGPFANWSDTWQLVVNTATTVFTYLAVFLIQNTQNRDAKAVHLKLDELISSVAGARNRLANLESLSDEELEALQKQFQVLQQRAKTNQFDAVRAIKDDLDKLDSRINDQPSDVSD
jgi:low affinity Fe/Cu permease